MRWEVGFRVCEVTGSLSPIQQHSTSLLDKKTSQQLHLFSVFTQFFRIAEPNFIYLSLSLDSIIQDRSVYERSKGLTQSTCWMVEQRLTSPLLKPFPTSKLGLENVCAIMPICMIMCCVSPSFFRLGHNAGQHLNSCNSFQLNPLDSCIRSWR